MSETTEVRHVPEGFFAALEAVGSERLRIDL